jgi:hypothetical protein
METIACIGSRAVSCNLAPKYSAMATAACCSSTNGLRALRGCHNPNHKENLTMAYEAKAGTGTLFHVGEKKNDNQPDLKGNAVIEIDGKRYQLDIAAWTKESERAGEYLSLSIKLKDERYATRRDGALPDADVDRAFGSARPGTKDIHH